MEQLVYSLKLDPQLGELIFLISEHPNIIKKIQGKDVQLAGYEDNIYSSINQLPYNKYDVLREYFMHKANIVTKTVDDETLEDETMKLDENRYRIKPSIVAKYPLQTLEDNFVAHRQTDYSNEFEDFLII